MPKKAKEILNVQDIACANLGFTFAQMALDMFIQKGLVTSKEVGELYEAVAKSYESMAPSDRNVMYKSAVTVLRQTIALKYSAPPKHQQN